MLTDEPSDSSRVFSTVEQPTRSDFATLRRAVELLTSQSLVFDPLSLNHTSRMSGLLMRGLSLCFGRSLTPPMFVTHVIPHQIDSFW